MVDQADVQIPARDGVGLTGTAFTPAGSADVVVINAAMAVPANFYRRFAARLADAGFSALIWDYRDVGASARGPLRESKATLLDWALLDMGGVIDWSRDRWRPQRLFLVGHSLGGQLAGLVADTGPITGMVTLSAQSGYWRLQGGEQKWLAALHGYLTLPAMSRVFGYAPWSRMLPGIDLPKRVALQWARWIRDPDYLLGDASLPLERFASFTAPVLAYSFADDKWGTAAAVDSLMLRAYPNVERRHVTPADYGLDGIGHTGFFRPASEPLWDEVLEWMQVR